MKNIKLVYHRFGEDDIVTNIVVKVSGAQDVKTLSKNVEDAADKMDKLSDAIDITANNNSLSKLNDAFTNFDIQRFAGKKMTGAQKQAAALYKLIDKASKQDLVSDKSLSNMKAMVTAAKNYNEATGIGKDAKNVYETLTERMGVSEPEAFQAMALSGEKLFEELKLDNKEVNSMSKQFDKIKKDQIEMARQAEEERLAEEMLAQQEQKRNEISGRINNIRKENINNANNEVSNSERVNKSLERKMDLLKSILSINNDIGVKVDEPNRELNSIKKRMKANENVTPLSFLQQNENSKNVLSTDRVVNGLQEAVNKSDKLKYSLTKTSEVPLDRLLEQSRASLEQVLDKEEKRESVRQRISQMKDDYKERLINEFNWSEKVNKSLEKKMSILNSDLSSRGGNGIFTDEPGRESNVIKARMETQSPTTAADLLKQNMSTSSVLAYDKIKQGFEENTIAGNKYNYALASINNSTKRFNQTSSEAFESVKEKGKTAFETLEEKYEKFNNKINTGNVVIKNLTDAFVSFGRTLTRVWNWMSRAGTSAKNPYEAFAKYYESLNLFNTAFGADLENTEDEMHNFSEQAQAWADRISNTLYINPTGLYQYAGALYSLVKGMGVAEEYAYIMGTNLTQLAYDMTSYLNLDSFEAGFEKIRSAISGQSRAVGTAGIPLQMESLEELADALGIDKAVSSMTQAEKTVMRYIALMRATGDIQMDLGKTINSPENALKSFKEAIEMTKVALGKLLVPIMKVAIPYFIALANVITEAANKLANFLGIEIDSDFSRGSSEWADIFNNISEEADGATGSINNTLAAFDDLNVVESAKTGSGTGGTGSSILKQLYDFITGYDMLGKYQEQFGEAIENAETKLRNILNVVKLIALAWGSIKIVNGLVGIVTLLQGGTVATGALGWLTNIISLSGEGISMVGLLGGAFAGLLTAINNVIVGINIGKVFSDWQQGLEAELDWKSIGLGWGSAFVSGLMIALATGTGPIGAAVFIGLGAIQGAVGLISYAASDCSKEVKILNDEISETSKKKLDPLVKEWKNVTSVINEVEFTKVFTQEDANIITSNVKKMSSSVQTELNNDKTQTQKYLESMKSAMGDSYDTLSSKMLGYYDNKVKTVQDKETRVNTIVQKALDEGRALTTDELNELTKLNDEIFNEGVNSMTETEEEFKKIMIRVNAEKEHLSLETANKVIKDAQNTRDKAIEAAKEQYETTVLEAQKMKDAGDITEDEYDRIVAAAETARDDQIKAANDTYDGVIDATEKGLGENSKKIDLETGKIKSNWEVFWDKVGKGWTDFWDNWWKGCQLIWGKITNWYNTNVKPIMNKEWWKQKFSYALQGAKDGIASGLDEIKTSLTEFKFPKLNIEWSATGGKEATGTVKKLLESLNIPTSLPKLNVKWFAEGGMPNSGDLFFANENGAAEYITSVGNRTAVANQDQMVQAITGAITQSLGNVGGRNGDVVVYIGNDKVYQGQGTYQSRQSDRYGTTYVKI